jgi:hypothetical protein
MESKRIEHLEAENSWWLPEAWGLVDWEGINERIP